MATHSINTATISVHISPILVYKLNTSIQDNSQDVKCFLGENKNHLLCFDAILGQSEQGLEQASLCEDSLGYDSTAEAQPCDQPNS